MRHHREAIVDMHAAEVLNHELMTKKISDEKSDQLEMASKKGRTS